MFEEERNRFLYFKEPCLDLSLVNDIKNISKLLEKFNLKNNTKFYIDEKRKQILHRGKEKKYEDFCKLREEIEKRGYENIILANSNSNANELNESEIKRVETFIAAQTITSKIQKLIEDFSKIFPEFVFPVYDQIKFEVSSDLADKWLNMMKESLENSYKNLINSKEKILEANLMLEHYIKKGKIPEEQEKEDKKVEMINDINIRKVKDENNMKIKGEENTRVKKESVNLFGKKFDLIVKNGKKYLNERIIEYGDLVKYIEPYLKYGFNIDIEYLGRGKKKFIIEHNNLKDKIEIVKVREKFIPLNCKQKVYNKFGEALKSEYDKLLKEESFLKEKSKFIVENILKNNLSKNLIENFLLKNKKILENLCNYIEKNNVLKEKEVYAIKIFLEDINFGIDKRKALENASIISKVNIRKLRNILGI